MTLAHIIFLWHFRSILIVTLPLLMVLQNPTWTEALVAELGLTAIYSIYAYFFNMIYDLFRPVKRGVLPDNTNGGLHDT